MALGGRGVSDRVVVTPYPPPGLCSALQQSPHQALSPAPGLRRGVQPRTSLNSRPPRPALQHSGPCDLNVSMFFPVVTPPVTAREWPKPLFSLSPAFSDI